MGSSTNSIVVVVVERRVSRLPSGAGRITKRVKGAVVGVDTIPEGLLGAAVELLISQGCLGSITACKQGGKILVV